MGNFFSRNGSEGDTANHKEIEELKQRLANIENLDRDGDGKVSKEEFDLWSTEQRSDISKFKQKIEEQADAKYQKMLVESERELSDARNSAKDMEKEINALKKINSSLENKLRTEFVFDTNKENNNPKALGKSNSELMNIRSAELSKQRINKVVEELLADPEVNIKYFPDGIERQIYRNIFSILINLMDNLVDTTTIKFMGHKLVFDLQPLEDDELEESEEHKSRESSESASSETKSSKKSKKGKKHGFGKLRA
jgi:hypothetical protein